MGPFSRALRATALLTACILFLGSLPLAAQEDGAIRVAGSGIGAPLAQSLAESAALPVTVDASGAARGFTALCAGEADLAVALRPISVDEEAACGAAGVSFLELVPAFDAAALVTSADPTFAQCLTQTELNALLAPSSAGIITDWSQINPDNPSAPISLVLPSADSAQYLLLDSLVEGDGLRSDAASAADDSAILSEVAANPGSVGLVGFPAYSAAEGLSALQLNTTAAGCTGPSADSFADRTYAAANPVYFYASAPAAEAVSQLLTGALSEGADEIIDTLGFTAPPAALREAGLAIVSDSNTGREFSRYVTEFTISEAVTGALTFGGASNGRDYLTRVTTAFTSLYAGVTQTTTLLGQVDGFRRLCNGEIDIALASGPLSEEQQANCAAAGVTPVTVDFGRTAVVLVANAGSDYLACLTPEQITSAWSAASTAQTWNEVDASFPDEAVTLFAPRAGSVEIDLLLSTVAGAGVVNREDAVVQTNADAAYRAAAAANVPGALALMTYGDYQDAVSAGQANITLVGVNNAGECVSASESALTDGSYPLSRPVSLVISQRALARPEVESFLWFAAGDDQYDLLGNTGVYGLRFADMQGLRNQLQDAFAEAQAAAAEAAAAEATPEATPAS